MKKILAAGIMLLFIVTVLSAQEKRYNVPLGDSPSFGPQNAAVTIIEFIDFQ